MSKFIKLKEINGPEFLINVDSIQIVGKVGSTQLRFLTHDRIEFMNVEESFEEVKDKLCGGDETL
ncbi:flagellar FlbD family protein [Snodgrassella alvi]|uniref:flagellar FlbD family protein n=1 Tax=Snodgrassella alvi TaxID=1196083 RepID=UPI000C1E1A38|nr:flagellar FlbD family protein [Snodgrassella alvi]PIT43375.1 hypothetical protein BHC51_11110 [Snodgrassella alvi]